MLSPIGMKVKQFDQIKTLIFCENARKFCCIFATPRYVQMLSMYLLINGSSIVEKLSKLKKNIFFLIFKINKRFLNNAYFKKKPQINGVSLKEKIKYCVKLRV